VPTVKIKDIELAYSEHGDGEPLLLIGGYSMVQESWRAQVGGLAKSFRVITFDNRGVGGTTIPDEPFTVADLAGDAIGLMDSLGIESAFVFGVSMGGLITQVMALDHPRRVRKAVLGCTTHGGRFAVQPAKEVMAVLGKAADPTVPVEESVRMRLPIVFADRFMREKPAELEEYVRASVRNWPDPKGAAGQFGAMSVFNVKKRLGDISCPVLVVTGDEDRMMPPENSTLLAEGIPGAELHVIAGAGHSFFIEEPEETNRVVTEFFKK